MNLFQAKGIIYGVVVVKKKPPSVLDEGAPFIKSYTLRSSWSFLAMLVISSLSYKKILQLGTILAEIVLEK